MFLNRKSLLLLLLLAVLAMPTLTWAQAKPQAEPPQCQFEFGPTSFQSSFLCVLGLAQDSNINIDADPVQLILSLIRFALTFAAILALIFVMYAGVRYIISRGEEGETEKAKKTLLYAVLGLLLIGVSIILVNTVIGALKGEDQKAAQPQDKNQGDQNQGQLNPARNR